MKREIYKTPRYKKVEALANKMARKMGNNWTGSEHLLFAILSLKDGEAHNFLRFCGISPDRMNEMMNSFLKAKSPKR